MKILNLYAGIGGNRKHWNGHQITAVENNPEILEVYAEQYPNDTIINADAKEYLLKQYANFQFIWASPPCPSHSSMMKFTRHDTIKYPDMSLYQIIILLKNVYKGLWCVENVWPYYEPLIRCRKIGRHAFWSNFVITRERFPKTDNFIDKSKKEMEQLLNIKVDQNIYIGTSRDPAKVLKNATHPLIGKHILDCAIYKHIKTGNQAELFNEL